MNENETKLLNEVIEKSAQKASEIVLPIVDEKVAKSITERMDQQALRKNIFEDGSASERQELKESKQKAAEYFKLKALGKETKALSSGTATDGAELVPTYVSDQLITVAQRYGLIRKYARKWPLTGINENIPTASTVTAYRLGSDTGSIQSSAPTTGAVQMRAKTVGVIVPISRVLLQNSTVNLVDAITFLAGKAIAKLEDTWGFLGINAGEGIFQNTSVPTYTLTSTNTLYKDAIAEDLLSAIDQMDENYLDENLRWIMSHSVLNNFRKLRSIINGSPNQPQGFLLGGFGTDLPATLWDIPYDTSAVMPKNSDGTQNNKKFVALANYDNIIYGDSMEYQMEMSEQATILDTDNSTLLNMFQQNMVALKIWGLVDIELSNASGAFSTLTTAAS